MSRHSVWLLSGALCLLGSGAGAVPSLTTLYTFHGPDGAVPYAPLAMDQDGNLYGTTLGGGPGTSFARSDGNGVLFELSGYNHFKFRTVMAFDGSHDGASFDQQLLFDDANNLFGTTGDGTVYELSGAKHRQTRYFTNVSGVTGLVFDAPGTPFEYDLPYKTGNLIGTSKVGGANGNGEFFSLSGSDHQIFTSLYDFAAGPTYPGPYGMIADAFGNLYGTTFGGIDGIDNGTVFELSGPDHKTFTTLASFDYATTGANPNSALALDKFGHIYGTTKSGGPYDSGTVFELTGPDHRQLHAVYTFGEQGGPNGSDPDGPLAIDAAGNIFGVASVGGTYAGGTMTLGLIFEVSHDHKTCTVRYKFTDYADGYSPVAGLVADKAGNLYGMTEYGGSNYGQGVIYKLSNSGYVPPR